MHPIRLAQALVSACALLLATTAEADGEPFAASRPDAHAPIGVMGDHLHKKGELMLSYRFMYMRMDENRDGTQDLSPGEVLSQGYLVSPTDMEMWMHMIGVMLAPSDWLTLMAMLPVSELGMDHVNAGGLGFRTQSSGVGDLALGGLLRLFDHRGERARQRAHLNAGFSAPIGNIDNRDSIPTPAGFVDSQLPYPMQTGSGTWDFRVGATYVGEMPGWSWGGQAIGTLRTGKNRYDYRKGDGVLVTGWLARPWLPWLSTSFRAAWSWWGNYDGADPQLNPLVVPTADPRRRGGNRLDLLPGLNFLVPLGPLGENRFAVEAGFPVYQSLDGPQLKTQWHITVGWQKAFAQPLF